MLNKRTFNVYMNHLESDFNKKLSRLDKKILYKKTGHLDTRSFAFGLISLIERFNSDEMPSIEKVASIITSK